MNTEYYAEWIRPPKELFSREWFDLWNDHRPSPTYDRIDETKRKLENLEIKLRIKRRGNNDPGYVQDLLVDTVTFLNSYIGVWQSTSLKPAITPLYVPAFPPHVTMIYPHASRVMSTWEEIVLGGVQRDGVCLSMLSSECVEWLNRLSHWVSE
jgi:hypothetical protein